MNTDSASHDAQTGGTNVPPDARPSGTTERVSDERLAEILAWYVNWQPCAEDPGLSRMEADAISLFRELQRLRSSGGACDSPLAAGDAFVAAFKREPKDPADLAWMNGYAAGRRAPEPREQQWQPIETAPKGRTLLLGYWNDLGNWRTVMGCYYAEETLESETEDSGFAPPGWYESTQAYEYLAPLDKEPTHWQPLPKGLPKRSQETKGEQHV